MVSLLRIRLGQLMPRLMRRREDEPPLMLCAPARDESTLDVETAVAIQADLAIGDTVQPLAGAQVAAEAE